MRIAVVRNFALDTQADGIGAYLRSFFRDSVGNDLSFWGRQAPGNRTFGSNVVACHQLGELGRLGRLGRLLPLRIGAMLDLWWHRAEIGEAADVIFVQTTEMAVPLWRNPHQRPVVVIVHGWHSRGQPGMKRVAVDLWWAICDRIAVTMASRVIMVSHEQLEGFRTRYPWASAKLVHLPTFVEDSLTAPSREDARGRLGIRGEPLLFCSSRLSPEKGIDDALRVLVEVRKYLPDARLLVAGQGHALDDLLALARQLGVSEAVTFAGPVGHGQIGDYYGAADFFLLLSRCEGMSISLLEALSLGVPVLVTDIADHRRIVKEPSAGFVVEPKDVVQDGSHWIVEAWRARCEAEPSSRRPTDEYRAWRVVPEVTEILRLAVETSAKV
jgi:glycosyltransferase involved in cell wall biosynthesis